MRMDDDKDLITDKVDEDLELLARHLLMLQAIHDNGPIGIIRLSEILGVPKHKIRYSLRLLEKDGAILPSQDGAVVTDTYDAYMHQMSDYLKKLESTVKELESIMSKTL